MELKYIFRKKIKLAKRRTKVIEPFFAQNLTSTGLKGLNKNIMPKFSTHKMVRFEKRLTNKFLK